MKSTIRQHVNNGLGWVIFGLVWAIVGAIVMGCSSWPVLKFVAVIKWVFS